MLRSQLAYEAMALADLAFARNLPEPTPRTEVHLQRDLPPAPRTRQLGRDCKYRIGISLSDAIEPRLSADD